MSQMTATARPLRAPRRVSGLPPLRVIPSQIRNTGNGAFAATCIVLLTCGLLALLVLNTALAQGSIALGQLQRESTALGDSASNLREQVNTASSAGALALKASQLGMVRSNERAYIDLATGTITGTASPASRNQAFPIVISPTPPSAAAKKAAAELVAAAKKVSVSAQKSALPPAAPLVAPAAPATPKSAGAVPGTPVPATLGASGQPAAPSATSRPTTQPTTQPTTPSSPTSSSTSQPTTTAAPR